MNNGTPTTGPSSPGQVTRTSTTYTSLTEPRLSAIGIDNNPHTLQITPNPTLETTSGTAGGGAVASLPGGSNSRLYMDVNTPLTNGTAYQFRASATNNPQDGKIDRVAIPALTSGESAWYGRDLGGGLGGRRRPTVSARCSTPAAPCAGVGVGRGELSSA